MATDLADLNSAERPSIICCWLELQLAVQLATHISPKQRVTVPVPEIPLRTLTAGLCARRPGPGNCVAFVPELRKALNSACEGLCFESCSWSAGRDVMEPQSDSSGGLVLYGEHRAV